MIINNKVLFCGTVGLPVLMKSNNRDSDTICNLLDCGQTLDSSKRRLIGPPRISIRIWEQADIWGWSQNNPKPLQPFMRTTILNKRACRNWVTLKSIIFQGGQPKKRKEYSYVKKKKKEKTAFEEEAKEDIINRRPSNQYVSTSATGNNIEENIIDERIKVDCRV